MKDWHIIIIGIGLLTGSMFFFTGLSQTFFIGLLVAIMTLGVAAALGYFTIKILAKHYQLNMHKAILYPWILATVYAVLLRVFAGLSIDVLVSLPLLFVFASIGGTRAYHIIISKA